MIGPQYACTVAEHAGRRFRERRTASAPGADLLRALHATHPSYLPEEDFMYPLKEGLDVRVGFVAVLKTPGSCRFSYSTAAPGVGLGGHVATQPQQT